jgi:hypothetical protein
LGISRSIQLKFNINNKDFLIFPYCKDLEKLKFTLENRSGKRVIYTYPNILQRLLVNNCPFNSKVESGVYEIPCKQCPLSYYGETLKAMKERINEHRRAVRNGNENSAIFRHINEKDHQIDWINSKIVFSSNDRRLNQFVEAFFIQENPNCNLAAGFFSLDSNTKNFMKKFLRNQH